MKRFLLLLPLLLTPAAQAVDYVKCEAMHRMYGRVGISMEKAMLDATDDFEVEYGYFPLKNEDPEGHAKWESVMRQVAAPYRKRINRIFADYEAEGCD